MVRHAVPISDQERSPAASKFQDQAVPPRLPQDPWFLLAITTVLVHNCTAAQIGNTVLDFIKAEGRGSVDKVDVNKFAIKAQVFEGSSRCGVKIRLYKQGTEHALEFQMRNGDALAFNSFYKQALHCLKSCDIEF